MVTIISPSVEAIEDWGTWETWLSVFLQAVPGDEHSPEAIQSRLFPEFEASVRRYYDSKCDPREVAWCFYEVVNHLMQLSAHELLERSLSKTKDPPSWAGL
jgi:hypothetical protein